MVLPTCDIFNSPKVHRQKQHNCHKAANKADVEPATEQVDNQCQGPEANMEQGYDRVTGEREK